MVEKTKNNFRFPGQYYIEETGLYYNWWRWYKTEVGRYIEVDPLNNLNLSDDSVRLLKHQIDKEYKNFPLILNELSRFTNWYCYVDSNPMINYDETGLIKCKIICKFGVFSCRQVCTRLCVGGCIVTGSKWPVCTFICRMTCIMACIWTDLVCKLICEKKEGCR